jgi:hypothetical protein
VSTSAFSQTGVDLPDPEPIEPREPEAPAQGERPAWLPSKFADERQFAESYTELERKLEGYARDKEEAEAYAQAMAEQLEYQQEQQQAQAMPQQQQNPLVSQWEQAAMMDDAQTQLALTAFVASQIADQKIAAAQPQQPAGIDEAQAGVFARVVDQDVRAAYEAKYNEPWSELRQNVGDFLASNQHWLADVQTPDQAVERIAQAADFVRSQMDRSPEQTGNPSRANAQQKYLGQTLQGHGVRAQAAKDAASELVERMKQIQGPYGYGSS